MRFAVVGAGAIGAYVGAALARGGADVTLIARGPHLAAMSAQGLRVISGDEEFTIHPTVTDDLSAAGDADVVFLGLKAYSLPAVVPTIGSVLAPGAAVVSAQNGIPWWYFQSHGGPLDGLVLQSVDPGGVIAAAIPPESVVGCVVYPSAELVAPGVVRHVEGTRFSLGEPDGRISARCEEIASAFRAGGLKAPVRARLRDEIWLKLLGNATFNPVSVLTGATLAQLGEVPEIRETLLGAFEEIAAVAGALGIGFDVSLERRLAAGIAVGDHRTSMLQDYLAGKALEHRCMTGAVVELAGILEIPVPRMQAINVCIELVDHLRGASSS